MQSRTLGVLQLWRVLHRTVNPVPRGKHSRFESVDTHHIKLHRKPRTVGQYRHCVVLYGTGNITERIARRESLQGFVASH